MTQPQYAFLGDLTGNELAYLTAGLCFVLAAAGWLLIAQPVKHVRNTHYTKPKAKAKKTAKRKSKK